jgi:hypothetical protein
MSNKLFFLISFVLVLSLAGNVLAYDTMVWDNDHGAGDRMWDTSTNWTWTKGGEPERAPIASDWVVIQDLADANNGPIIDANTNAVCQWLDLGYDRVPVNEAVLTMTGGTITGCIWMSTGYYYGGTYRFDMSGGTIDLGRWGFTLGWASGSYNTFNMSGGTFNCEDFLSIGTNNTAQADMNMTGGDVNLAGWLEIGASGTTTGVGHVDLHGGTLETILLRMGGGGVGTMDFANDGTLIIDGDYRIPNDWLFDPCSDDPCDDDPPGYTGTIAILADRGLITAYNTQVGEIITNGNYPAKVGLRAVVNLDYDVTHSGRTTITGGAVDPNLAWDADPLFGSGGLNALDVNRLSWAAGDNAATHEVYFGTDFNNVNDANTSITLGVYEGNQPLAEVNYPVSVTWNTTYYWRIDEVNDPTTWKGTVWNFVTIPAWATNHRPTGTSVSPLSPVLMWDPGPVVADVNGHYLYFSTDFNDVNDRDPSVLTIRDTNNYAPGDLELNTKYYWAVDEVNLSDDPNIWPSPNWNFTTVDHLTPDNFNPYANTDALQDVWTIDHLTNNGAELQIETDAAHVRDGKSMLFAYRNTKTGTKYVGSEAVADAVDLQAGSDWTFSGIEALVLYFQGDPCNAREALAEPEIPYHILNDQMYVAVEDGDANVGIVKYDTEHGYDMNDVKKTPWQEWNIELADPCLADVNMANVAKVYIGFGGAKTGQSGSGAGENSGKFDTVWFDDIQLWPPRCVSAKVVADIAGDDCITNYNDVDMMARDWLMYDYNVPAVAISSAPVGWWKLDEGFGGTTVDSSGYGNDGTIYNEKWVGGYPNDPCDSGLHFDGDGIAYYDRVVCAERSGTDPGTYPAELMPATFTVACWVKCDSFDYFETFVSNGVDDAGLDQSGFYLFNSWDTGTREFGLGIRTEAGMHYVITPAIYETDTWYHLAATYNDANTVYVYVDGERAACKMSVGRDWYTEVPTADVGGPIRWVSQDTNSYPDHFLIGALHAQASTLWWYADGSIDDVRVYDYAMPYGEIVTLAEQGPVLYHDLISPANISDLEAKTSKKVNFRDYVILADHWLKGPILWP